MSFRIAGDVPDETLREIVEQSRARSAVYDVFTNGVNVTIDVVVLRRPCAPKGTHMRIHTVVIGGGQAGLAMSAGLTAHGIDHVVIERGHVANAGAPSDGIPSASFRRTG